MEGAEQASGWMITGFQSWVFLWIWVGILVVYGVWRSLGGARPDPIQPSGPFRTDD